jgi:hypothetical protein
MAKRKGRGAGREVTRAEIKAIERRAASVAPVATRPASSSPAPSVAPPATGARRGVLPPRLSRVATGVPALSREEELAFIRDDLRRLTILSVAMLLIIIVLSLVLPFVIG